MLMDSCRMSRGSLRHREEEGEGTAPSFLLRGGGYARGHAMVWSVQSLTMPAHGHPG